MAITLSDIDNWFTYHPPVGDQAQRYEAIRAAGRHLAFQILASTPPGADQTAAIRKVREAVMTANAAIACGSAEAPRLASAVDSRDAQRASSVVFDPEKFMEAVAAALQIEDGHDPKWRVSLKRFLGKEAP